jgi:L-alanine-DL-glutamate epimerase-like enolase superfamily enzyme
VGDHVPPVFLGGRRRTGRSRRLERIDCALWDIKGKALGQPVWRLLGGRGDRPLRTYASQLQFDWGRGPIRNLVEPAEYEESAAKAVAEGYDCVKVDPIQLDRNGQRDRSLRGLFDRPRLRLYRERMEAVRRGAGDAVDIIVELHSFPSASGAHQLAEVLGDLGILFIEEPVHYASPSAHQSLARRTGLRMAAGERLYTRWGAEAYLGSRCVDVLQPDFGLVGGITEGKKMCDLAHLFDVTIQGHVCGSPVATAVALHVEAAIPNFEIHEHHVYALKEGNRELCLEDLQPVQGRFAVPNGPGLGIELNQKSLADAERILIS